MCVHLYACVVRLCVHVYCVCACIFCVCVCVCVFVCVCVCVCVVHTFFMYNHHISTHCTSYMNFMCVHLFDTSAKYIYWSYSIHGSITCHFYHFSCSDGHIYTHACSNYHILNCILTLWATRYKYISSHALLYCFIFHLIFHCTCEVLLRTCEVLLRTCEVLLRTLCALVPMWVWCSAIHIILQT